MYRTVASATNGIKRKELLVLFLCLIIGFALRVYAFDHKSLWIDEVHTFNDSREGLKGQLKYFKEHPADFLHPPLFYALTHVFYPFEKPERELRIIPLIFGILLALFRSGWLCPVFMFCINSKFKIQNYVFP